MNLSQMSVAEKANITLNAFSYIERAQCTPTLISLIRIAQALECSIIDFLPKDRL